MRTDDVERHKRDSGADHTHECVLVWVDRGAATVHTDAAIEHLVAGEALWVPAGVPHTIEVDPGSLCFPIAVPARHVVSRSPRPSCVRVPPAWRDWLIHQFAVTISPLRTVGDLQPGLGDLLRVGTQLAEPDLVLPLPRTQLRQPHSAELRAIADQLMLDPGQARTTAEWAAGAGLSTRTLQRRFLAEVALSFRRWRTACRLLAAADLLTAGRDVGWVADSVGFASLSGFSRAFRAEFGVAPSGYAALVPTPGRGEGLRAARRPGGLDRSREGAIECQPAPDIAPSATPLLVNDFHVIIWVYRGRARVRMGERTWDLGTGDAIWLPAGVPNRVEVEAHSVMVPIQSAPPATRLSPHDVDVFAIPAHEATAVLGAAVAQYTRLRPPGYDDLAGWHAFERSRLGPASPAATTTCSATHSASMESARRLLSGGMAPGAVAGRLGYAHASSFSRAFSRTHGVSPRTFQRQGAAPPPVEATRPVSWAAAT